MLKFRLIKKTSICLIVITQVILLSLYFFVDNKLNPSQIINTEKVSFLNTLNVTTQTKYTYHTSSDRITLELLNTRDNYVDFNTSLCFINGTDARAMHKGNDLNWNCKCLPTWHGKDCSQPEVIWRALLAYRKPIIVKGPRKYQRRIICIFVVDQYSEAIVEITINELNDVVDLFVIYDNNSNSFGSKFAKGLLKQYHKKILYMKNDYLRDTVSKLKNIITNLNEDDIILVNEKNLIPNKLDLIFFKFYDNWPEPLSFRLRWSIYGFFWLHPEKTKVRGFISTVRYLYEVLNNDISFIKKRTVLNTSFIIGDLNHYGGWYCELCNDASEIVKIVASDRMYSTVLLNLNKHIIDSNYIEELIENGVYIDGETQLTRGHRYNENYFAPSFVCDNSWKFDYLLINMYSKLDYYQ